MPRNSLEKLLDLFPYFLNREETSNFFKSQSVTNNQFKEVYSSLFSVYEHFNLNKNCFIWKEQSRPYEYSINFIANYPHLKSVTLYKNGELIYMEQYNYGDFINNFIYSYEGSTLNTTEPPEIVPTDTFQMDIETYDEHQISKGYPENDEPRGDIFDHNNSLDIIGKIHNIPRKRYLTNLDEIFLESTEPPYNINATEDDYHYLNRIITYLIKSKILPLPVAEIWKIYGFEPLMECREKYLIKMFDLTKHPSFIDETKQGDRWFSGTQMDNEIIQWTPEPWEHQDTFCNKEQELGSYFFVSASTKIPVKNQGVLFKFYVLNSLGTPVGIPITLDITLNNQILETGWDSSEFMLSPDLVLDDERNYITFVCKNEGGETIGAEELIFEVRGCNTADYYVNPNGDDENDGRTASTAFRTIQGALNKTDGKDNLIVIQAGTYEITSPLKIQRGCNILGCGDVTIQNSNSNEFFELSAGEKVVLTDLILEFETECSVSNITFENDNTHKKITILTREGELLNEE